MPRRGGPKHHPDTTDRHRAAQALDLRLGGLSWEQCAKRLGYRSPGGPRMAVERLLSRVEVEGAAELRRVESRRLDELLKAVWPKALRGDTDAIRTVLKLSERRSKLLGLDAPQRVEVEAGISEQEFAEAAAELYAVTGDRPLRELAGLPPAPSELPPYPGETGWSNLPEEPRFAAWEPAAGTSPPPSGADPSQGISGPFTGIPVDDPDPDAEGDDPEEPVEVVAELIEPDPCGCARPPAQRAIAAVEVLDENGVPRSRTGLARRLGGYNALAGWQPG